MDVNQPNAKDSPSTSGVYECFVNRAKAGNGGTRNYHCCVPGCNSDSRYENNNTEVIWFHSFPSDKTIRKAWIIKIRRDEGPLFNITRSTVVCSLHFKPSDYKWSPVRKTLIRGAVPSIFSWNMLVKARSGRATNRISTEIRLRNEIDRYVYYNSFTHINATLVTFIQITFPNNRCVQYIPTMYRGSMLNCMTSIMY